MKKIAVIPIALLLLTGLTSAEEGKIPITTRSPEALQSFLKGRSLSDRLQGPESIQHFERAVELDPDFAQAHLLFSFVQPTPQRFFDTFARARALADQVSEGERLWILGVEAGVNGQVMKQRELYQQLVSQFPDDERAHNLLGNHFFGQQEYETAIAEYEKALAIAPDFSQPYNQLGYAHRFMGDFEKAKVAFEKYIELIPDDPNPHDSYAELLMKMGQYDASITSYRKALTLNPNFVASHIGIATNLNFKGQYSLSRAQLEQLYSMARNDGERRAALFATAVSFVDEGDFEAALKELQKQYALAAAADDAPAMAADRVNMGNILLETGRTDEAVARFLQALEVVQASGLTPEVKDNNERGYLYNAARAALQKRHQEAAFLDTAKTLARKFHARAEAIGNPNQLRLAHQLAGLIAMAEGRYAQALAEFQQSSQQNPYNLYRTAVAHFASGDWQAARQLLATAANFNALNNMNYAFIRHRARRELATFDELADRLQQTIDTLR